MATIQDVAKEAGVSVGTVSRALNHYTDVSEATREKVQNAAKKLGYWPNLNARSLSSKTQINVALILSGFLEEKMFNEYETMLMKGSYSYALEHDIEIAMRVINSQIQKEKTYDQLCHEYGMSGALFFGLKMSDEYCKTLPGSNHPCVIFDFELEGPNIGTVMVDNQKAFQELTQHLIDCNHKKIVLMHGRKDATVSMERLSSTSICPARAFMPSASSTTGTSRSVSRDSTSRSTLGPRPKPGPIRAASQPLALSRTAE